MTRIFHWKLLDAELYISNWFTITEKNNNFQVINAYKLSLAAQQLNFFVDFSKTNQIREAETKQEKAFWLNK